MMNDRLCSICLFVNNMSVDRINVGSFECCTTDVDRLSIYHTVSFKGSTIK